ncbi:outer membrane beta-barrel family protein [Spirosoma endbachense]|nr:outer membrane beta-barrel family protein [Spirosoma endbachense]
MNKPTSLRIVVLVAFVTLWTCAFTSYGQTLVPTYKVSGQIADSATRKPLEFVTLTLMADSHKTIRADYSKPDGSFVLASLKPGSYSVVLTMVGYRTYTVPVMLADTAHPAVDLGLIALRSQAVGLSEVIVKAAKPVIRQEIDRIAYDLQADPDSKVYNVLEMMRKVPFLSVDAQENILLKGGSNYRIFINSKPSGMLERNPRDVLRSMPASTIERIEVITNPPARYDAEGLAGIINIITFRQPASGYKGSVNLSERFPVGGPGIGGSLSAQLGKLGLSVIGGGSLYNTPRTSNTLDRLSSGNAPTQLTQTGSSLSDKRSGYMGYELSYELSDRQLISSQFNLNGSRTTGAANQHSALSDQTGLLQAYDLASNQLLTGNSVSASLNYQLGFKADKDRFLTLSYRYYAYGDQQQDQIAFANREQYVQPDYRQDNDQRFAEQSFQFDYVSPIKKVNAELGLKAILRQNNSDFTYRSLNPASGTFEPNADLSNRYNYDQNVLSAYTAYQYNLGNWNLRMGVRAEQTLIDADFTSTSSRVNQQYTNLIPSLAVSRKLENNRIIKLGWVHQIRRPNIQRLNPFVDRSNPNVETSGNPNLRPSAFNRLQLGYGLSGKFSVNMGLDYTFVRGFDLLITILDPATNISRSTYENTGRGDALDYSLSGRYPVSKNWDISFNGMFTYFWSAVVSGPSQASTQMVQYFMTASSGYRFEKGWRANASLNLVSASIRSPQEKVNGLVGSSVSVTKTFIPDKLSFSALVNNPFTPFRTNRIETVGAGFAQVRTSRDYFRSFSVSLNYNFGKLTETIQKNKREIKNDDLAR